MKKHLLWLLILLIALSLVGCDQLLLVEESTLKTVYVGPERVDCEGEGPQTCYLIKENPEDDWSLWYQEIDGFDYEPGYEYELVVSEEKVENPPAGGSSINWTLQEVVAKTPVGEGSTDGTAGSEPAGEEPPAQAEFVPIAVEDLGITTVAPADWPKIEDDPLLKDAWGPGQYRFMAFHSVAGDDVQEAMAKLLSTTAEELADGTVEGEYWQEEIGGHSWAMYAIDNPDVGLVQTVSMTSQEGTVYVVSLFIETEQKDAVLQPVLESFVIEGDPGTGEADASEAEGDEAEVDEAEIDEAEVDEAEGEEAEASETEAEEEIGAGSADLINTNWVLTTYDDGSGQLVNVLPPVEVTALFAEDGRVSGFASCNSYVSLYTVEGNNLTVSIPAMTRKECADPPDIMIQETGFLGNLTTVVSYQIEGSELQLFNELGGIVLTFSTS